MQAPVLNQGNLGWKLIGSPQNVRHVSSQNPQFFRRTSHSRYLRVVRSAQQEDFTEVEQKDKPVPSILKLPTESRNGAGEATSPLDGSDADAAGGFGELIQTGTVKEVFQAATKAVADAPVRSVGQVALYSGMTAFALLISGAIMNSVDHFPFIPETLETVGVIYSVLIASQLLRKKTVSFPPPSPFKAVIELVDNGQSQAGTIGLNLQEEVSRAVAAVLERVVKEKDTSLTQVELKKAADKIATVLAEREALEDVALQLADERDGALSEVSALKDAITAMTSRIKGIEEMLEREVSQLKQQNQALETVSLQLAAERDAAVQEMEQLRSMVGSESQSAEKEALEVVAIQVAQERDEALSEIEELKKVVAILREATATASGLTSEQEVFIKARVRDIRSQFIDQERTYDDQKDQVEKFIDHLVTDYGAPRVWVSDYIKQFLKSSATKFSPPPLSSGLSQVENLKKQTSRNS
ncbi:unnamed protein product [Calypogeia fissa]